MSISTLVILGLALFRLCRLLGWDEITVPLRGWLTITDRAYDVWTPLLNRDLERGVDPWPDQAPPFTRRRWYVAKLIRCPWCLGVWLSIPVWACWHVAPRATLGVASVLALAAIPGLVAKNLDP